MTCLVMEKSLLVQQVVFKSLFCTTLLPFICCAASVKLNCNGTGVTTSPRGSCLLPCPTSTFSIFSPHARRHQSSSAGHARTSLLLRGHEDRSNSLKSAFPNSSPMELSTRLARTRWSLSKSRYDAAQTAQGYTWG